MAVVRFGDSRRDLTGGFDYSDCQNVSKLRSGSDMEDKIVSTLEAWQEQDGDYIMQFSYRPLAIEIISRFREWGVEPCTEHNQPPARTSFGELVVIRRECPDCWKSLTK